MDDEQKQAEDRQLIRDFQITFDSDSGRRVLENLKKWSGYEDRIIPQGVPDVTAFELGRRDMFLHIKDKIDTDLDKEVQTETEG